MKFLVNNFIISADSDFEKKLLNTVSAYHFTKGSVIRITAKLIYKPTVIINTKSILKFIDSATQEAIDIVMIDTTINKLFDSKIIAFKSDRSFDLEMPINSLNDDFKITYNLEFLNNSYKADIEL